MFMSWNYRVLRTTTTNALNEVEHFYTIHEVYYEKDGRIHAWSSNGASVGGDTFAELHTEIDHMRAALNKPVLTISPDGKTLTELP